MRLRHGRNRDRGTERAVKQETCTRRREILVYSVNEAITTARRSRTYAAADTRFFLSFLYTRTLARAYTGGVCD